MLNFGPRGSSMVTIPLERLEAGVEYTFNLIVWKAGRKEEATNQTVGCAHTSQCGLTPGQDLLQPGFCQSQL